MSVKHAPPDPLPHRLRGDAKYGYIVTKKGEHVDEIPFEAWQDEAPRIRKTWRYYVHAGNAYPALIESLRDAKRRLWEALGGNDDAACKEIANEYCERYEKLLRKLGEDA